MYTTILMMVECTKVGTNNLGWFYLDFTATALDQDAGTYEIEIFLSQANTTGNITAATQASPVAITSASHGLSTGDEVMITGVGGMTDINDLPFTITRVDANTFTIGVDGTGYDAYTSGGTWTKLDGIQTGNRYYWDGTPLDDAGIFKLNVKEDF